MIAIQVGNTFIDLDPDVRVPLNMKASEAKDAGEIFTSFTNSFDIPWTPTNVVTFENSQNVASLSRVPYRVLECRLLFNGRDLFGRSRLVLLETNKTVGWKAAFYAGDTSLAFAGTLRDLPLSDLNFIFTPANCAAKADDPINILYAPVNYGVDFLQNSVDIRFTHFQFYCKSLIGRMFQTLNIPLIVKGTTPLFDKMVLPMLSPKKIASQWVGWSFVAKRATSNQVLPIGQPGPIVNVLFNQVTEGNQAGGYNPATGVFAIPYGSRIDVEVIIDWNVTSGTSGEDHRVWEIVLNGKTVKRILLDVDVLGQRQSTLTLTDFLVTVPITDLHVKYQPDHSGGSGDQVLIGSSLAVKVSDEIVINNTMDIAASMPDMEQGELFTQIVLMSNSIIYFQFGQVVAMPFANLSQSEVVDLSNKLDISQEETTEYQSGLGRITTFRYDNDSFAPSKELGGAKVEFDNQALPASIEWAKLSFAACRDASFAESLLAMVVPVYLPAQNLGPGICSRSGGNASVTVNFASSHKLLIGAYFYIEDIDRTCMVLTVVDDNTVTVVAPGLPPFTGSVWSRVEMKVQNLNPRIGLRTSNLYTAPMTYRYMGTTANVPTYYGVYFDGVDASVDGLSWVKLLKRNFLLWLGSMEHYKLVRAWFNITDDDALNVDFTRQYYVKKYGSVFYLQAVNKYVSDGNSTEVELFRLGDFLDPAKIKPL